MKVAGRWRYLHRVVDQYGQVIDVLLAERRDTAAARRFFLRALRHGPMPVEITTTTPSGIRCGCCGPPSSAVVNGRGVRRPDALGRRPGSSPP